MTKLLQLDNVSIGRSIPGRYARIMSTQEVEQLGRCFFDVILAVSSAVVPTHSWTVIVLTALDHSGNAESPTVAPPSPCRKRSSALRWQCARRTRLLCDS